MGYKTFNSLASCSEAGAFEMPVNFSNTTQCNNRERGHINTRRLENLKFQPVLTQFSKA
jgi:hypothetical protein